jgi:hypothetical protein
LQDQSHPLIFSAKNPSRWAMPGRFGKTSAQMPDALIFCRNNPRGPSLWYFLIFSSTYLALRGFMSREKWIKPFEDYSHMPDGEVVSRGMAAANGMDGNPDFPVPPVKIADFRAAIQIFSALIAETLNGDRRITAQKNNQRTVVIDMLKLLGRYVEVTSDGEMAAFLSSGFEPASNTKVQSQLSKNIWSLDHGPNSGSIVIRIKALPEAYSYELRYGIVVKGEPPQTWVNRPVTRVKTPITIDGLTPTATYAFQVRTLMEAGYTDWSDSVTLICT